MGRNKGPNTTYIYSWPAENLVKIGVSERRRWLSFGNGGVLVGYYEGADAYRVEEQWQRIIADYSTRAFQSRDQAIPYLRGDGGGWCECYRLNDGLDALSMLGVFPGVSPASIPDGLPAAMHVTVRTERTDGDPPRRAENLSFLNARDDGAAPRPDSSWCTDHGVHKPCGGCRADELAGDVDRPQSSSTPDARTLAAGGER